MALQKKAIPAMDISSQLNSMNSMTSEISARNDTGAEAASLRDIPQTSYIPPAEYGKTSKPKAKKNDNTAIIGFKIPKEAKTQYQEYFANFGLNLSEASKNALEYFIQDLQKGKVKITLTHHFERVED